MVTSYRRFEPSDLEDVLSLELRQKDIDEAWAFSGIDPTLALAWSLKNSEEKWVVVHKGKIEGVFGVVPGKGYGIPWFVATNKFNKFRITFAKTSQEVVAMLLKRYHTLMNFVDSRHKASIRWLRWLGFDVDNTRDYYFCSPYVPFYEFKLTEERVK